MEDAAELFMEGVDHTTGHWDQVRLHFLFFVQVTHIPHRLSPVAPPPQAPTRFDLLTDTDHLTLQIKGHTGKAFGRSRRQSGGGSGREKSKRDVDDDRTFQYDNDRDDPRRQSIGDFDGRRGRQGSDDWDARQYASPQMSQARYGGRPGMQRRTSSLDRQQFPDGRVARYRGEHRFTHFYPSQQVNVPIRARRSPSPLRPRPQQRSRS